IALALQFDCAVDPEAVELQSMIAEKGYEGVLRDVCGLKEDHSLFKLVISHLKA
ncbi:mannitol-1-phosphate 5-dehydrogenase, partial [Bacillus licheniformis]|nr:mannitol-1-phosphate 5-dehydrogenase [Bacillus licheniformis]